MSNQTYQKKRKRKMLQITKIMSERRGISTDSTDNKRKIRLNNVLKNSCLPDTWAAQLALVVKNPSANEEGWDTGLIPGWGRTPGGGGYGNQLQYSGLENPMDRGAGGLQSTRSQRDEHNWSDWARTQGLDTYQCDLMEIRSLQMQSG